MLNVKSPNVDIKDELKRTSINITCYDRNGKVVIRSFLWHKEKEPKKHPLTKAFPQGKDAICYGQRPPLTSSSLLTLGIVHASMTLRSLNRSLRKGFCIALKLSSLRD